MRWIFWVFLAWCSPVVAAELKVATWNLEWLTARPAGDPALPTDVGPKLAEDIARLHAYAGLLAADVVAIQEVDGPEIAARIFTPDRFAIAMTHDRVVQRVGLAIRRGIAFTQNADVTGLDIYPWARYRLRSGLDVTLHLGGRDLRILAVHLKTGCREAPLTGADACATLRAQLAPLQGWIAPLAAGNAAFLVIGDFNRWMDGTDAFWAGLRQAGALARATEGRSSPCWGGGGFIDHIIAGGAAGWWRTRCECWCIARPGWRGRSVCPTIARYRPA
jgi:endonuclease/exonuclease/phosphatase family metal-dependent hydrolase